MANRLILASSSPRRLDLLRLIGVEPVVSPADIDESGIAGEGPAELVLRLASSKAQKIAATAPNDVVLGADTIVLLDGEVMNKPIDSGDAIRMLSRLGGTTHQVLTAVAVVADGNVESEVVRSSVTMRALSDSDIDAYVASGEPFGKAGSYAIQGYGAVFVTEIQGSFHNVMGLPLHMVELLLERCGHPLRSWVGRG